MDEIILKTGDEFKFTNYFGHSAIYKVTSCYLDFCVCEFVRSRDVVTWLKVWTIPKEILSNSHQTFEIINRRSRLKLMRYING